MVTRMYVVFDKVAKECGQIFHQKNDDVAARSLAPELNKANRPEDYELRYLGEFDHEECHMYSVGECGWIVVPVAVGKQFVKREVNADE